MRSRWKSGRFISISSILVFVAIALSVIASSVYVNNKMGLQEEAEARRMEYRELSDSLADASDHLTAEVRYFAVTGDVHYLYNYWFEIYETQRRNHALERFEEDDPPQQEQELLEQAKQFSDLLVETETLSMKLKLLSLGKSVEEYCADIEEEKREKLDWYIEKVLSYEMPEACNGLSLQQMQQQAIVLLYDSHYEEMKKLIMDPIAQFQVLVNERLDDEVTQQRQQTHYATGIQILSSIAAMIAIAFLVQILHRLYIWPLQQYTEEIRNTESTDAAETKIRPQGTEEMFQFVNAYNSMLDRFYNELKNRKEAEEDMRKARNEAEIANEAKSVFLAQVSHELRTPLNAVNGYTYLLEQTSLSDNQTRYVKNIRHSSDGLLELINQILDFTKIDSGKLEFDEVAFDVKRLVEDVCQILILQAKEKGISLEWSVEAPEAAVIGDQLRLKQVLMNLIGNAIKFTEEGSVEVAVKTELLEENQCVLYFEVKDTGIGIAYGMKEKIFEPFAQADASVTRRFGGTGLGLPISSQIIALAGSKKHRLHMQSMQGKGTKFSFRMDFLISDKKVEEESKEITIWDGTGRKVLVTDDNKINLSIQSELLKLCRLTVLTAQSGKEALQVLRMNPDIELVFMDIRMPEIDGYETALRMREIEAHKRTPVIALTADATHEVIVKCMDATMVDCLLKPVEQRDLFDMVGKYLNLKHPLRILSDDYQEETEETASKLFDEEKCLKKLSQNTSTFLQLVGAFLEFHGEDGVRLGRLLEENRKKEADELLHLLKGVAGNLCCRPLIQEIEHLRNVLQWENKEHDKEFGQFLGVWNMTLRELQICYRKYEGQAQETSAEASVAISGKQLEQLIELCEARDTEAVTLVEKYALSLSTMMDKESYLILKKSSIRYDFVTMANCIKRLNKGV